MLRHLAPPTVSLDDADAAHDPAATDANPDDRLDVVSALARIALIHREVLVLHYFDDMPTADMAEALEIPHHLFREGRHGHRVRLRRAHQHA